MKAKIVTIIGGAVAAVGTLLPLISAGIPGTLTLTPRISDVGGLANLLYLLALASVIIGIARVYREFGHAQVWSGLVNGAGALVAGVVAVTALSNAHELVNMFGGFGRMFAGADAEPAVSKLTDSISVSIASGSYCMVAGFLLALVATLASGRGAAVDGGQA